MTDKYHRKTVNLLRVTAVLGTIIAALFKLFAVSEIKPNQQYGFYALILIGFGTIVSLIVLARSFIKVLEAPDLLVPVGLYIFAGFLSGFLIQSSPFIGFRDGRSNFADAGFAVVSAIVLQLALAACFTGWMTRVILKFVETGRVDLTGSFENIKWWFPRTALTLIFGWLPVILLLFVLIPLSYRASSFAFSMLIYPIMFAIAAFSLIWNLATAVLLPHVLTAQTNLREAIGEGLRIGWLNKAKTIVPVILLMLVSGWIVFISVTFNDQVTEKKKFGEYSFGEDYSIKHQTNYSSEFVWVADYPEKSKWHAAMMGAVKQEPLETMDFRIMLLLLLLSVTVNLEMIRRYFGRNEISGEFNNYITRKNGLIIGAGIIVLFFPVELFTAGMFRSADDDHAPRLADLAVPKVFTDDNVLAKTPFLSPAQVEAEHPPGNVFVGDFDGKPGIEKVIAYRDKAVVYDERENLKSEIKFELGKTEESSGPRDADFSEVKVADIDGDGVFEFIGIGSYPHTAFVVDQKGSVKWKYQGKGNDINTIEAVDLDNDKRKELVIAEKNFIKIFDHAGKEIKTIETKASFIFDQLALTVNPHKSGEKAFLAKGFSDVRLFDLSGKQIGSIKMPDNIVGFLSGGDQPAHSLFFDDNMFGLFDLDGNLEAKYEAPYSEVKYSFRDPRKSETALDKAKYVFSAQAEKIRINEQGDELLAVLAELSGDDLDAKSMLYVYDGAGKIVYQELFDDSLTELRVAPSASRIGTEDVIILDDRNIWRYSVK